MSKCGCQEEERAAFLPYCPGGNRDLAGWPLVRAVRSPFGAHASVWNSVPSLLSARHQCCRLRPPVSQQTTLVTHFLRRGVLAVVHRLAVEPDEGPATPI